MMGNRNKKAKAKAAAVPVTEVDIKIKVVIQEIHSRTLKLCDERIQHFSFAMGHDFEKLASWLKSSEADIQFGDLCAEVCALLGLEFGGEA